MISRSSHLITHLPYHTKWRGPQTLPYRSSMQVRTRAIWIACVHCLPVALLFRRTWFWGRCWEKQKIPSSKLSDFEGILWFRGKFLDFSPYFNRFLFLILGLFHPDTRNVQYFCEHNGFRIRKLLKEKGTLCFRISKH